MAWSELEPGRDVSDNHLCAMRDTENASKTDFHVLPCLEHYSFGGIKTEARATLVARKRREQVWRERLQEAK
jgi:hypothetical protein